MSDAVRAPKVTKLRIERAFWGFGCAFLLVAAKVTYLETSPTAAHALSLSQKVFEQSELLPARRGAILADDNTAIAVTVDEYTVGANPRAWSDADKETAIQKLVSTIGGDPAAYRAQLARETTLDGKKKFYVKLAEHVSEEDIAKLQALMGPQPNETRVQRKARKDFWAPLDITASPRRDYPLNDFAPQLIGFSTNSGVGVDGMEKAFDGQLSGQTGYCDSLVDAQRRPIPGTMSQWKEPLDGDTVVTTIDPRIQAAADATMNSILAKYKPNFCVAVVMKPKTGEIVAVSTAPTYNLNQRPADLADMATNRAFSYNYEPGSTFKIITASAAVENIPDWQDKKFVITGEAQAGNHTIHDWEFWSGRAKTDVKGLSEGIRDSSNCTMWKFAQLMPRNTLPDYARKFGVGERPDIDGFNLHKGWLPTTAPKDWSLAQWANFSFGQGMMITPLQLARIGGVIADGGLLMKPILVKEVLDPRGRVVKVVERRVIAANTAFEVAKMMRRVVAEGTARKYIFIPGYAAAGKTGSAQKAVGKAGYAAGKFISSFVGYLPMNDPQYVIAVMADEPHGSHWGSEVCGPAFTDIAQAAMLQMRLALGSDAPAPDPALMQRPAAPPA